MRSYASNNNHLSSRVESLFDTLINRSKIHRKKCGAKVKRELCRDFVSVIMGVRPAFMLDYAPLLCKEDVELMCKELNEELFLVRSSRSNGGEGVHLKVCTVLDTVVLVTIGGGDESFSASSRDIKEMPILVNLDEEQAGSRRLEPSELVVITACRAKVASNSRANIDETDLGDGVVKIPPQTFVGWMLGYPILYYYGLNKEENEEWSARVAARKLSLCSLVKIECIDDKNEVMYGFTYPESLNEDALIKETLKSWMDGIQKQKQQYAIGLSVRVTHCRPSPVAL